MTTERLTMDCIYCNADSYLDDGGTWECDFGHRFAAAPERAPAYAGHQAHPCPVCLNVHGGKDPLRAALEQHGWYIADVENAEWVESSEWLPVILAALTERSAT